MHNFIFFLTLVFFFISCTNETSLVKVKKLSDSYTNKLKLYAETGKRNKNYLFEALEIYLLKNIDIVDAMLLARSKECLGILTFDKALEKLSR